MSSVPGIQNIPAKAKKIEGALKDLVNICQSFKINYVVIGSVSMVSSYGKLYRIPYDVDVLYDVKKEQILERQLLKLGYTKFLQNHKINGLLKRPLERFTSGVKIIEPRRVEFSNKGMIIPVHLPTPLLNGKLGLHLRFSNKVSKPRLYKFGEVSFFGLSNIGLYIALKKSAKLNFGSKKDQKKRFNDMKLIEDSLNSYDIEEIKKDKSGIYFKSFPLLT